MTKTSRRQFVIHLSTLTAGTIALQPIALHAQARVDEKDPQAAALGYRADTTQVDNAKFPKHTKEQNCRNCQLFQGKAGDEWGGCPLFPGRQVAANGWCSAWVKKAG